MTATVHRTGQEACHDRQGRELPCRGSGQDAEFKSGTPWPSPRFEVQAGVVLDRLTGLVWTRDADPAGFPHNRAEALAFVDGLNSAKHLGFFDWRLPNRRELLSLVAFNTASPCLPAGHPFERVVPNWYWSGTPAAGRSGYFWNLEMLGGRLFFSQENEFRLVWPVRGMSPSLANPLAGPGTGVVWPEPRFVLLHEDAVRDSLTGLVWARRAHPGPLSWPQALAAPHAAIDRVLGGRVNWRLPTILELESLVDAGFQTPALTQGHPFLDLADTVWSSTNSGLDPSWSMCLYLHKGALGVAHKPTASCAVWVVSGGSGKIASF
jgi:hypothetical protein